MNGGEGAWLLSAQALTEWKMKLAEAEDERRRTFEATKVRDSFDRL